MRRWMLLCVIGMVVPAARADTQLFDFNGSLYEATEVGTIQGTLSIDRGVGTIVGFTLSLTLGGVTYPVPFPSDFGPGEETEYQGQFSPDIYNFLIGGHGQYLDLFLNTSSLVGYNGSPLCSMTDLCDPNIPDHDEFSQIYSQGPDLYELGAGEVTPAEPSTVTPEPGTLTLLGTGVLGLAGVLRRGLRRG